MVKGDEIGNRRSGVQEYFRHPRNQDQDKNEHVIAFQPSPYCLELGDLETGQNQIFAHEFFPFALKHFPIFHHHRDKKMRFEHPHAGEECVVKTVPPCLYPKQHPNNGQIKKENDVRHFARRKRNGDNGGGASNCPVCGYIEPLPPHHDPPHFAPIKMRHCVDIARIINAPLQGDCPLLFCRYCCILDCHDFL